MKVIIQAYRPGEMVRATVDGVRVVAAFTRDGGVVWRCNRHKAKPWPHCEHTEALAAAAVPTERTA